MRFPTAKSIHTLRKDAADIWLSGVHAVHPLQATFRFCSRKQGVFSINGTSYDLDRFKRVFVIGAGKATASMAKAIENLLADRIDTGLINVKYGHTESLSRIRMNEAGHPTPDVSGLSGAAEMFRMAQSAAADDLILCLISGGGSALLPLPADGISLSDKQRTIQALLSCGAAIHEINTIRKHISAIKGGRLAKAAAPASVFTLILSDVIGDDPAAIASGPTVPDNTTFQDCITVVDKYRLWDMLPASVLQHIKDGAAGQRDETLKTSDSDFGNSAHAVIGSNSDALAAARNKAESLGYHTMILSSLISGETKPAAEFHAAIAAEIRKSGNPVPPPACILSGGETTVHVTGTGLGGRNMEFALAYTAAAAGQIDFICLSAGTDGTDGPTDAAGAFSHALTLKNAKQCGMRPDAFLAENDSYHFFQRIGDLFVTGPTNTNVMDLRVLIVV
ncbi:MAG: glycerate kinase [Desulfobacterales bacterium]